MSDWDKDLEDIGCIKREDLPESISLDVVRQLSAAQAEIERLKGENEELTEVLRMMTIDYKEAKTVSDLMQQSLAQLKYDAIMKAANHVDNELLCGDGEMTEKDRGILGALIEIEDYAARQLKGESDE